jgi:hypothetical protein
MRIVIEGLEKGGLPERMIKPLLAKTLIPARPPNSSKESADH